MHRDVLSHRFRQVLVVLVIAAGLAACTPSPGQIEPTVVAPHSQPISTAAEPRSPGVPTTSAIPTAVPVQPTAIPAQSTAAASPTAVRPAGEIAPKGTAPSPAKPTAPAATPATRAAPGFLHTEGSRLVDSRGQGVRITGINWFGLETPDFAPHGLWERSWTEMLDQVVDLGFNTLRLPFSTEMLDPSSRPRTINYQVNPDLRDLTPLEILDLLVDGAGKRGLRVILDRHRPEASGQSPLWYTGRYGEDRWIADWKMLAARYRGNPTVIGADLHNEPRGDATWGSGDLKTDWRLAAEHAGNAILEVNPDWLIVIEGIERFRDKWYWWGGNLMGVAEYPVRLKVPQRVVYSPHDYGPGVSGQSWFSAPDFPKNLPGVWNSHWAYIPQQGLAPVLLGEFGGRSVGQDTEGIWQRELVAFLKTHGISYTYWTLNPNSGDTGGILKDDWRTVQDAKLNLLKSYQAPLLK